MDEEQSQNQPSEPIVHDIDQDEGFVSLVDDDDLTQTHGIPSTHIKMKDVLE